MIDRIKFSTGAAVGANGSATATGYSPHITGKILKVHVAYLDSPPAATTDLYLYEAEDPNATEYIVNLQNAATDATLYPRRNLVTNTNVALVYSTGNNVVDHYVACGRLAAKIDGANAADYVEVTVWFES